MTHKKSIASVAFLLLGLGVLQAQESPIASGGEATGTGGTSSYSVGQVAYTTATGAGGNVVQGIQQPIEVSTILDISKTAIHLEMTAYPNPTVNQLNLEVEEFENLNFQLLDTKGVFLKNGALTGSNTSIEVENLDQAVYFLHVMNTNGVIKTFKIVKQ